MTRPLYESEENIAAEEEFSDDLAAYSGYTFKVINSPNLTYDRLVLSGAIPTALAELKCRAHSSTTYPTIMLALKKVEAVKAVTAALAAESGERLKPWFCFRLKDADYIVNLNNCSYKVDEEGGRTRKTRDILDIEPVIHIPLTVCHRIDYAKRKVERHLAMYFLWLDTTREDQKKWATLHDSIGDGEQ